MKLYEVRKVLGNDHSLIVNFLTLFKEMKEMNVYSRSLTCIYVKMNKIKLIRRIMYFQGNRAQEIGALHTIVDGTT